MYATYKSVSVGEAGAAVGTGWLPPLPDLRDYTEESPDILPMVEKLGAASAAKLGAPPTNVDLRNWCSPIENQQALGSCTAHAAVGVVEYLENRVDKLVDRYAGAAVRAAATAAAAWATAWGWRATTSSRSAGLRTSSTPSGIGGLVNEPSM